MVDHGGDHQVYVDSQRVVEHEPDEGQEGEDVADWNPAWTCWTLHISSLDKSIITTTIEIFSNCVNFDS